MPLVGNVAMDAVMADVTEIPGVNLQDEFVLLGEQGGATISGEVLARVRNTIPWEVVTSMSFRLPRVYHAASVLMGLRTLNAETWVATTRREEGGGRMSGQVAQTRSVSTTRSRTSRAKSSCTA